MEGTTPDLVITDQLPTDSATGELEVEYKANSVHVYDGDGNEINSSEYTVDYNSSTGVLTVDMGDYTNASDTDDTNDFITIKYDGIVQNEVYTNNNDISASSATVNAKDADDNNISDTDDAGIAIAEPKIKMTKDFNVSPSDLQAGDTVEYKITIEHDTGSTADAYDIMFTDVMPEGLLIQSVNITPTNTTAPLYKIAADSKSIQVGSIDDDDSGIIEDDETFDLLLNEVNPQKIVMIITAVVQDSVEPNQVLTNNAQITWTSLDGYVNAPQERDGSDTDTGSKNDYYGKDSETTGIKEKLAIEKKLQDSLPDNTKFSIGETVPYEIQVDLMEGTTPELVITDQFPTDSATGELEVEYKANSVHVYDGDGNEINSSEYTVDYNSSTGVLTVDMGDYTNASDTDDTNDFITIKYDGIVQNEVYTNNNDISASSATVNAKDADDNNISDTDDAGIAIAEPKIKMTKDFNVSPSDLQAGDTVEYKITIEHDTGSTADAYDIMFTDVMPEGLLIQSVNITPTNTTAPLYKIAADSKSIQVGSIDDDDSGIIEDDETFDLLLDSSNPQKIVMIITAVVQDSVEPNQVLTNNAQITWTSLDGYVNESQERDGSDTDTGSKNDYYAKDSETTSIKEKLEISKTEDGEIPYYRIGEFVPYKIQVDLMEGTTPELVITDQLPKDPVTGELEVEYEADSVHVYDGDGNEINSSEYTVDYNSSTGVLTVDMGDYANASDTDDTNDFITIKYYGIVQNEIYTNSGDTPSSSATVNAKDADDNNMTDTDDAGIALIEPKIKMTKDFNVSPSDLQAGDTVEYKITIEHDTGSTADAYDIMFTDVMPEGLLIQSVNITPTNTTAPLYKIAADSKSIQVGSIDDDDSGTIEDDETFDLLLNEVNPQKIVMIITAVVQDSVEPNQVLTNNAQITWTSLDGYVNESQERDGSDTDTGSKNDYYAKDSETTSIKEKLAIEKRLQDSLPDNTKFSIGETVPYEIQVDLMEGTTPELVITDQFPTDSATGELEVEYKANSVHVYDGDGNEINSSEYTVDYNSSTGVLTVDMGDYTNASDTDDTNDFITIKYDGIVQNEVYTLIFLQAVQL